MILIILIYQRQSTGEMSSKPEQDDESHPHERRGGVDSSLESSTSVKELDKDSSTSMRGASMMREIQEMKRGDVMHASDERTTEVGYNLGSSLVYHRHKGP